jgi:TPR repeat protein
MSAGAATTGGARATTVPLDTTSLKWTAADDDINEALLQQAKQGSTDAQVQVGLFYFHGKHGFDDDNGAKSVWWLEHAAASGSHVARGALGRCYVRGFGVARSYAKALGLFEEAAAHNDPTALAGMGYLLMDDSHFDDNDAAVAATDTVAAEGTKCDVVKDDKEAYRCLKLASDLGSDWGQSNLAHMYLNGRGIAKNEKIALELCKRAASGGYYGAQTTLGWCYVNGKGTPRDPQRAAFWYRKAAEQGDKVPLPTSLHPPFLSFLPCHPSLPCHSSSLPVPFFFVPVPPLLPSVPPPPPFESKDAQNWLGWAFETGIGVKKDVKIAGQWYPLPSPQFSHFLTHTLTHPASPHLFIHSFTHSLIHSLIPPRPYQGTRGRRRRGVRRPCSTWRCPNCTSPRTAASTPHYPSPC